MMECRNDEFHRARQLLLAVLLSSMLASVTAAGPDDWPMFRGHGARGVAEGHPVRSSWKITYAITMASITTSAWAKPAARTV